MNAENTTATVTAESLVTELNIDSPEVRQIRRQLTAAEHKVAALREELEVCSDSSDSTRERAIGMAQSMLDSGNFEVAAIEAALKATFVQKRVVKTGEDRVSHKLADDTKAEILSFVQANPDGVGIAAILEYCDNADKTGVAMHLRYLRDEAKAIVSEGTTRKCVYKPVSA